MRLRVGDLIALNTNLYGFSRDKTRFVNLIVDSPGLVVSYDASQHRIYVMIKDEMHWVSIFDVRPVATVGNVA